MSSAFGLWPVGQISNALLAAGVAAVVLVSPAAGVAWGMVVSGVLLRLSPATRDAW